MCSIKNTSNKRTSRTVLVIDDDKDSCILLDRILQNAGYFTCVCNSLETAYKMVREHSPHLIVLDMKLSGENGFNFLGTRLEDTVLKNIPVLVLTNLTNPKIVNRVLSYPATDFLEKPINAALLLQKIKKFLRVIETKKYNFSKSERPTVKVTIPGEIFKISEVSLLVSTSLKMRTEDYIQIQSELLKDLDIESERFLVKKPSHSGPSNAYLTEVVLLGVTEKSAQLIRKIRRVKE